MPSDIKIEIDPDSGFCFGVVTAIKKAEEELEKSGSLFCIGDIVHNNNEVERLKAKGLVTISHADLESLRDVKVLLRAHGEPPETYETARRNNIEIIDATCPVVLKLQKRIRNSYLQSRQQNTPLQVVIYGKPGHAEVNGLVGQTDGTAIVVEKPEEVDRVDPSKPVILYSQTTKSVEGYNTIIEAMQKRLQDSGQLQSFDTICRSVANRVKNLKTFAHAHDCILFVSDNKSSNGRYLFSICRDANHASHFITRPEDVTIDMLSGVKSIGISGATSTPRRLMEEVEKYATTLLQQHKNAI